MSFPVALVDDHRVVTRSLKAWLESFPDLRVVGIAVSVCKEELLQHLAEWKPDVILQDLLMPGGIDGIETTRRILLAALSAKVIALTASVDEARMMGVLRAGAVTDMCARDAEPGNAAGRRSRRGARQAFTSILRIGKQEILLQPEATHDELTPRETNVLRQLALGRSNKEIATALSGSGRNREHRTWAARIRQAFRWKIAHKPSCGGYPASHCGTGRLTALRALILLRAKSSPIAELAPFLPARNASLRVATNAGRTRSRRRSRALIRGGLRRFFETGSLSVTGVNRGGSERQ